jgi:hypothetical protein
MINHPTQTEPHFDAAGPVNAPAMVLAHGSVVTRKMWLPQMRGLSDAANDAMERTQPKRNIEIEDSLLGCSDRDLWT